MDKHEAGDEINFTIDRPYVRQEIELFLETKNLTNRVRITNDLIENVFHGVVFELPGVFEEQIMQELRTKGFDL